MYTYTEAIQLSNHPLPNDSGVLVQREPFILISLRKQESIGRSRQKTLTAWLESVLHFYLIYRSSNLLFPIFLGVPGVP